MRPFALTASALALASLVSCAKHASHPPLDDTQPAPGLVQGGAPDAGVDAAFDGGADAGITALVTGSPPPQGIALDPTYVYYTYDNGARAGAVMRVARAGGVPEAVAAQQDVPYGVVAATGGVAWTFRGSQQSSGGLALLPGAQGSPRIVASGESTPAGIATDGAFVYWISGLESSGVVVERASFAAGAAGPDTIGTVQGLMTPAGLALDATFVYFVTGGPGAGLFRTPIAGGTPENLYSAPDAALTDVAASPSLLFVTSASAGVVLALPIHGGPPKTVAGGQSGAYRLAVDDTFVYWTTRTSPGAVMRAPLDGSADASVLAGGLDAPAAIAVDDAIYVTTADAVLRIAK